VLIKFIFIAKLLTYVASGLALNSLHFAHTVYVFPTFVTTSVVWLVCVMATHCLCGLWRDYIYVYIYKFVCVYMYILYTWLSFGLLKGLVVLSVALGNFRIKVPTECTVIGGYTSVSRWCWYVLCLQNVMDNLYWLRVLVVMVNFCTKCTV